MNILKETSSANGAGHLKNVSLSPSLLLCNSCYWCATQLEDREVLSCPKCAGPIAAIPLEQGEIFCFDADTMKGVRLCFKKRER